MNDEVEVYEPPMMAEVGDFSQLTLGTTPPNIPDIQSPFPYLPRW